MSGENQYATIAAAITATRAMMIRRRSSERCSTTVMRPSLVRLATGGLGSVGSRTGSDAGSTSELGRRLVSGRPSADAPFPDTPFPLIVSPDAASTASAVSRASSAAPVRRPVGAGSDIASSSSPWTMRCNRRTSRIPRPTVRASLGQLAGPEDEQGETRMTRISSGPICIRLLSDPGPMVLGPQPGIACAIWLPCRTPITFAHRGARSRRAREHRRRLPPGARTRCSGLETDAWVSGDGEVVLVHDGRVRRGLDAARSGPPPAGRSARLGVPRLAGLYRELGSRLRAVGRPQGPHAGPIAIEVARAEGDPERLWLCTPPSTCLTSFGRGPRRSTRALTGRRSR